MGHLPWGLFSLLSPSRAGHVAPPVHKDQALGDEAAPSFLLLFSLWVSLLSLACISCVTRPNLAPWVPRSEEKERLPSSPQP